VAAAEALVADADTLPDPILGLEYGNMPLTTPWPGEHPMSGVQLRVSQTFPGPGKRSARVAEARGRVDAARARLPSLQNRLAGSVVTAWHRLAGVRRERVVTAAHIQLVDQLIEVVQVSYEVGRAAQHELLQLQTLRERLSDDLLDFEQRERAFVARLNAILHRAPDTPVPTPEHPTPLTIDPLDDLRAAVDDHPTLEALEAAAQAESRGAERFEGRAVRGGGQPRLHADRGLPRAPRGRACGRGRGLRVGGGRPAAHLVLGGRALGGARGRVPRSRRGPRRAARRAA
jgi:outer membrane protein TolC